MTGGMTVGPSSDGPSIGAALMVGNAASEVGGAGAGAGAGAGTGAGAGAGGAGAGEGAGGGGAVLSSEERICVPSNYAKLSVLTGQFKALEKNEVAGHFGIISTRQYRDVRNASLK